MAKAVRAIIIENGKLLVMYRNKQGSEYYTLVGGRINDQESMEQALVRELKEETGLTVTAASLVFTEEHEAPYNDQFIYYCEIAPHDDIAIQDDAEEKHMNHLGVNIHQPFWVPIKAFDRLPFRTPQLQHAIVEGLKKGFPQQPVKL